MKKKRITIFAMLVLTVTTLAFTLSGCKQFNLSNSFTEEFGKTEYGGVEATLEKITAVDSVLGAYGKLVKNFDAFYNVAYRAITEGTATSNKLEIDQTVYTTYIKQQNINNPDQRKVYFEDAATSTVGIGNSIVKTMYDKSAKVPYTVKFAENSIGKDNNGYPTAPEDVYTYETYDSDEDYLAKYYTDLNALTIYLVDNNTIDMEKSSVKEVEGFIDINLVFRNDKLQDATNNRREIIALKATYGGMVSECKAENVKFSELTVTFRLWKSGLMRAMFVTEKYTMRATAVIGEMTQNCNFTTTAYFSHDPEELPMSEFEFKKP
ncbi:MAG: hypothetical protein SPG06_07520 [Eubacteriales bacterium]|nr:hypothetical protein [Eubacteriales bacterium]